MKKILFLIPNLAGGGAERVLVNLVNNLDYTKYRVTVQTLFDIGTNRKYLNENIEYISGFPKQFPGNVKLFKIFSPTLLYRLIIKKRYDVVISYLEGPTTRIVAGCPYNDSELINWVHVEQHNRKVASYSFRTYEEATRCLEKFRKTICVAETVKKDYISIFDLKHPCEVLYNTNENEKIILKSQEDLDEFIFSDDINIVSIGRLRQEKGYDRLINVHKKLLDAGIKNQVYILGNGESEKNLKEQMNNLSVENTFHLLGFQENPYKYVAKADLFVCSSRKEGFSTAVTEALILGVPVVSTNCSGAYELLGENNEYGIVTENNEEALYEGIYQMLSNPDNLLHYRKKAEIRGKYFSKDETVKAVENMLDSLFEEK